ncbi:MAG TPA: glycine zipper domain-containing protein, partial [Chitinophagaceae bacterium]
MARPHHRKKHKQHLQQFKHRGDASAETAKSKGSSVFAVGGAVFGFAIGYIISSGSVLWMIIGLIVGGAAGYFLGERIDKKDKSGQ